MTESEPKKRQAFDRIKGVEIARELFHRKGYDAVSVADLVRAIDVNPPSLYAAYGSKIKLFEKAIESYSTDTVSVSERSLIKNKEPHRALCDLLVSTARRYTENPECPGCMIAAALQAADVDARNVAERIASRNEEVLRSYVVQFFAKKDADAIVPFILVNLRGLSSESRRGVSRGKLVSAARIAGEAISRSFDVREINQQHELH